MKIKSLKFKSVNSTNDIALDLIKRNKFKPTLISAEQQIKGRGTMGKKWVSKKGNLYLTIYFEIDQKKINFKHYAVLNAHLLKYIIRKNKYLYFVLYQASVALVFFWFNTIDGGKHLDQYVCLSNDMIDEMWKNLANL